MVRKTQTRSGSPNVEIDGIAYHSPYDPIREAQRFYAGYQLEQADVVVHFGWGLGYGADAMGSRLKPGARVFVFEPNAEVFGLAPRVQDKRFQFVVGDRLQPFLDTWNLTCGDTDRILWIEWPQAVRLYENRKQSVRSALDVRVRDLAANLLTHFQNGSLYFENAIRNFEFMSDPDVGQLFGKLSKVPLVVVSAGPSLDRNIRYLRDAGSHCFILAVDTALRPLLRAGITPHAVIIADPTELNARHILGVLPPSTFLIAEQAIDNAAMKSAQRRFQFSVGVFPDSLFSEFGLTRTSLQVWGSVATAALDLACKLGSDPVIFIGQDFSFPWNRDYASNTIFHGSVFDPQAKSAVRARDVWGKEVWTSKDLIAYRDFFVRHVASRRGIRFINATEGGILAEGFEVLSLRDALYQSLRGPVDVQAILSKSHTIARHSTECLSHLRQVLERRTSNCLCLKGFLELVCKRALLEGDDHEIDKRIEWAQALLRDPYKPTGHVKLPDPISEVGQPVDA